MGRLRVFASALRVSCDDSRETEVRGRELSLIFEAMVGESGGGTALPRLSDRPGQELCATAKFRPRAVHSLNPGFTSTPARETPCRSA
ncbi:hypothetical protein KH5H1_61960 [Corallococcus caeni]|nr:hypothetical protein KH5H1_61960 [Corallococcus sp. KH5-1]